MSPIKAVRRTPGHIENEPPKTKRLRLVKQVRSALLPLIFIPRCACCLSVLPGNSIALCETCRKSYSLESKMLCRRCGRAHMLCNCRIEFERLSFPLVHITGYDIMRQSVSKNIILGLKDNHLDNAFDFVSGEMAEAFNYRYPGIMRLKNTVVSYVPRSARARRKAGHDQSRQIALGISEKMGTEMSELFLNRSSRSQKTLGKSERLKNAKNNYVLKNPDIRLDGKTVIIVDDVVTTGSSVGACAVLAKACGAKAVFALVFAKTESFHGNGDDMQNSFF